MHGHAVPPDVGHRVVVRGREAVDRPGDEPEADPLRLLARLKECLHAQADAHEGAARADEGQERLAEAALVQEVDARAEAPHAGKDEDACRVNVGGGANLRDVKARLHDGIAARGGHGEGAAARGEGE